MQADGRAGQTGHCWFFVVNDRDGSCKKRTDDSNPVLCTASSLKLPVDYLDINDRDDCVHAISSHGRK